MKVIFITIFSLLITSANSQNIQDLYRNQLEPGSKLIKYGANFTLERTKTKSFIYKRYHIPSRQITLFSTYTDRRMKNKNGLFFRKTDNGKIIEKGYFKNNLKVGRWHDNLFGHGSFKSGKKDGIWEYYSKDSVLLRKSNYNMSILDGEEIYFDSLGVKKFTNTYSKGKLIHTTDSLQFKENVPRFPGCEHLNLKDDDRDKCSQRKMLEYVYGNLKYPRKALMNNIQGTAMMTFVIDKKGHVIDLVFLNSVSPEIETELRRLVSEMPQWIPGEQDGKKVKVKYTLPVKFRIE